MHGQTPSRLDHVYNRGLDGRPLADHEREAIRWLILPHLTEMTLDGSWRGFLIAAAREAAEAKLSDNPLDRFDLAVAMLLLAERCDDDPDLAEIAVERLADLLVTRAALTATPDSPAKSVFAARDSWLGRARAGVFEVDASNERRSVAA